MKKLVSLVLVMVMVLSLFTIVPFSASAADTKTVYFQNNWMWTDVKVYYWGSSSTNSAGWPGDTPQLVGNDGTYDIYAATVPNDIAGIIFNGFDGGIGANNQTPDIVDSSNGDCYYMVWNNANEVGKDSITNILPNIDVPDPGPTPGPTPSGTKTVYFQNNWLWTDVKAYFWGSSSTNSAEWPGDSVQVVDNDGTYDYYAVTVPSDVAGVIFNGFDGGIGGNNQTPDIIDANDGDCYAMVWNDAEGKNGVEKIPYIVNPTNAPETQAPETEAPETQAPVTEAPEVDGLFVKVDGKLYEVEKGDKFTYNYYLSVDSSLKISSLDINMLYDTAGLDLVPYTDEYGDVDLVKHFPNINGGVVHNFAIDGEIYYNYSSVAGIRLVDDALIFTAQFEVTADKGIYEISEKMITLADSDMNKIVYNEEVIQDVYTDKVTVDGLTPSDDTQAPETQGPVDEDGLFVVADGVKFAVKQGDVVTYNYYLSVDSSLKISSLDINMFYDKAGLEFVPFTDEYGDTDLAKHFPIISGGVVNNFGIPGEIYYNYSSVAGVRLADNAVIFTGQFKVTADKGEYKIDSKLITLADSDMNKIVYDQKDIQPDVYSVKTELVGGTTPTEAPETQAPVTQAPETQAPATTPVVSGDLFVVADGVKYPVSKGDVITYTYYLSVDSALKISSLDINMFYDKAGLEFVPFTDEYGDADLAKHFPKINGGVVNNFGIPGEIYYNYSSVAGVRLADNAVIFTGQFKVTADKGEYKIDSKLITLADSDMNKIVYDQDVLQPDVYSVKTEVTGGTTPETKPTETTKPDDGLYVRVDEKEIYAVKKGDVVTYRYILNVPNGTKISSIDMNTFYDTDGLDFIPYTDEYGDADINKHFPKIFGGCVHNFGIEGEIYYNYSNVAGIRLTNDAVMFEGQFKVTADKGTYDINTKLVTLADSDMNKIVYNFEVVQAGLHEEKELLVGLEPGPGPEPELLIGDVNRDGKINVFDVTLIQRYSALFIEFDAEQMIIADTNFDGKVNIFDASEIQRFIAGDITEFTPKAA